MPSSDELLDLVNESDEIIGEVWRNEANANKNLIHREVSVILFDSQKKILLQKRAEDKKVMPGFWTMSASGHIPKGDSKESAAHMELTEELGFDTDLTFWEKELIHLENETHFTNWFVGKYDGQKITLQESEVADTRFVAEAEFEQFVTENKIGEYTKRRMKKFWAEWQD